MKIIRWSSWLGTGMVLAFSPLALSAQGTLEGTVSQAGTGSAVAGAQVSIAGLNLSGTTRPNGQYEITGIPAGTHTIQVLLIGYRTEQREVTITDGQMTRLDVALTASAVMLEGLVAVGSRSRPRTVTESSVPVDAIPAADFVNQGDTDLSNLIRNVVPSYNVNVQPISDAATISRPANLRNLAPDHTLVLVNGKRRHRAGVISWLGNGVADGSQGPDISAIPALALRQVEVLRDGASAQYGSDAIAGVLNFQLRDDRSGGSFEMRGGTYSAGDGESYAFSGNIGLPLGESGFANLTGEYGNMNPTDRSVQRSDAAALLAAGNSDVRAPAQIWGSPEINNDLKLWGNFGYFFNDVQAYAHGNFVSKKVTGGFFFRNPNTRGAVFSNDGGQTLLIGDLTPGTDDCPVVTITNNVPDPAALAQVFADPNCFSFQEMFPGGFTPQFGGEVLDGSAVAGLRGTSGSLGWDASFSYGSNQADFFISNTVNASLGPATPTEFDPGLYRQEELNLNLDLTYRVSDMVHLAAGAEWRDEHFTIGQGQKESYEIGPLAAQGFSSASNGFPGFGPIAAGDWNRSNIAAYGDAEIVGANNRWSADAAVRFEDFADFGNTFNGKVSMRAALTDAFSLRASASTGFRAPTPGQQNAFNVSTEFDAAINDLVNKGTIPSTSPVAALRGGKPLEPEASVNIAGGVVLDSGPFSVTADYFWITVSGRLSLTQDFKLSSTEVDQLIAEGITSARNLRDFRFFTNDFDTRTQGVDVVGTYTVPSLTNTTVSLVFNRTNTEVTDHNPETLNEDRIKELQEALPKTRWNVAGTHVAGPLRFLTRVSYFGSWFDSDDEDMYDGSLIVDAEAAYTLAGSATLTLGAQNLLNSVPSENKTATGSGRRYSQSTPFGFNGALVYARVNYRWDW